MTGIGKAIALLSLAAAIGLGLAWTQPAAAESRYVAVFADGRRVEGNAIQQWHDPGAFPKLDTHELMNASQPPLRWLRDTLPPASEIDVAAAGFVEMVGGDRIPGTVVGFVPGEAIYQAGHFGQPQLLVKPEVSLHFPADRPYEHVRVLAGSVRRVVWGAAQRRDAQPGTLYFRDGRSLPFRGIRWDKDAVRVLTAEGPKQVPMRDLAEAHLPAIDPWDAYFHELSLLAPDPTSRLVRLETVDGLTATASLERFRVAHTGGDPNQWYHMVQPAWSLDPLWLRFPTIRTRQYFAAHEVPLTRFEPVQTVQKSLLGGGWRWQLDRNVQESALVSGGQHHGWGFGVHATCELSFQLSPFAQSFRTRIGLDRVAGDGGCVRARVFVGKQRQQIFESDFLVGSARGVDTGDLTLATTANEPLTITLQADSAHQNRPAGADPLDIRDALDWLEPLVTLNPDRVREEIVRRTHTWVPAWEGWTINAGGPPAVLSGAAAGGNVPALPGFRLTSVWEVENLQRPSYSIGTVTAPGGVVLSRKLAVPRDANWLLVAVRRPLNEPTGRIAVRIDGETSSDFEVPFGPTGAPKPLTIPLAAYRGKQILVEIEHQAGDRPTPLVWSGIVVSSQLPTLARVFEDRADAMMPEPLDAGLVQLIDADPYSGARALRVEPAGGNGVNIGRLNVRVREQPLMGEFRYLRFALRMSSAAQAAIDFGHPSRNERPIAYDAGMGKPALERAVRVVASAPAEWIVITRDLFADFGAFDVSDLTLLAQGEGFALFDHFYFARSMQDFEDIGAQDPLTLQEAGAQAAQAMFRPAIEKADKALVLIRVGGENGAGGRLGGGTLISADGFIATTGYVAVAPGKQAEVTLADGRKAPAITLGINRDADLAMLKITAEGEYPFIEIGNSGENSADGRLAAVAWLGDMTKSPRRGAAIVRYRAGQDGATWLSLAFQRSLSGGPLVNRAGQLVGLQSRPFGPGGTLATPSADFAASRERLSRSEVWGSWPAALIPLVGMNLSPRDGKLQVIAVRPNGPAAKAGIQVGDEVLKLDGQTLTNLQEMVRLLGPKLPGEQITLDLLRQGEARSDKLGLGRQGD